MHFIKTCGIVKVDVFRTFTSHTFAPHWRRELIVVYTQSSFTLPDVTINPFRIKPPEGEMMAIKKGNQDGPLDRIVASVSGWHFRCQESGFVAQDEWEKWELLPNIGSTYTPREGNMLEAEFGIIVVGFVRALHFPHIRYAKWEKESGKTRPGLVSKDRADSPFFFFQYTMGIPVFDVESIGNFKTTININVVVRLVNPYKALFLAGGWESLLDAAIYGAVRDHIAPLNVEKIRREKESGRLAKRIMKLNDDINNIDSFKKKFGVEIKDVRFVGFEITGGERVQNALEAQEVNRLLAEAAKNKAEEIKTIGEAEGEAASKVTAGYGSGLAAALVEAAKVIGEAFSNRKSG